MNNKNVLIALIVILIGLTTFLGGYLVAQKSTSPQQANIFNLNRFSSSPANSPHTKNGNLPELIRLSTVKALYPAISEDGKKILYFEKESGKVLNTDFSGQTNSVVLGKVLPGLTEAQWAPNGTGVITRQGPKTSYLNLKTEESTVLNDNISGMAWSKNSQKIAYLFYDPKTGEGQISIANPDGSVFKNILPTRAEQLNLNWLNDNQISFHNPTGEDHSLFLLNIENKELEKVLDSLSDLKVLWSPNISKLLYSYQKEGVTKLFFLDLKTKTNLDVELPIKASQCVWSLSSLFAYCGNEKLYQLDVAKKEFGLVFQPSPADQIKIKKPVLSPAEDFLFFVNDSDGYLYRISLDN